MRGMGLVIALALFALSTVSIRAYPTGSEEDKLAYGDYSNVGAHQLASWLTSQLRRNDFPFESPEQPTVPYRLSLAQGKRNSELTNSMMNIPRNMIQNGKK